LLTFIILIAFPSAISISIVAVVVVVVETTDK